MQAFHIILLIDVDKDVSFDFSSLEDLEFKSFHSFTHFNRSSVYTHIIQTTLMKRLMGIISDKSCKSNNIWIEGPPGSGKTTTLFWLYEQCKDAIGIHPVSVPIHHLDEAHYKELLQDKIRAKPTDSQLVFFIDINKPLQLTTKNVTHLESILANRPYSTPTNLETAGFVCSVSSNFSLYLKVSPAATELRDQFYRNSGVYTTTRFTSDQSLSFLSDLHDDTLRSSVLAAAHNIPKLLSLCHKEISVEVFNKRVSLVVEAEFDDMFKYISFTDYNNTSMLEFEAKLLWAVKAKLPYTLFGIDKVCASQLWLVKSFLVSIVDDVPELYFPLSGESLQFYTKRLQSTKFQTDNVNVMNDLFENSIANVILPKFKAVLRSKKSEVEDATVEFV